MMRALIKVIVARFYEQNTAFFLFIFFLMFGVVESSQLLTYHYSLMLAIINAPVFLLVVFGVWLVYTFKCVAFVSHRFDVPENEFLFRLNEFSANEQRTALICVMLSLEAPVLIYSTIVVVIAIHSAKWLPAVEIIMFHIAVIFAVAGLVRRKINNRHIQGWTIPLFSMLRWPWPRPFPFFYIGQLTSRMKTMLAITKAFSFFSIIGFLQIPGDGYDVRIPLLGFLFGLAGHTVIIFEFRRFEDQYLFFTRNLPLSILRRFAHVAIVYLIILIPELALLLVNHVHPADAIGVIIFGTGFLMTLHTLLYKVRLDMDRHTQYLLAFFLISFMLVLMRLYLVEAIIFWGAAFYVYHKSFYEFEGEKG